MKPQWPDFFEFYREVGDPPGPVYMLAGAIPGTKPSPGNTRRVESTLTLGPTRNEHITPYKDRLFDDDVKDIHKKACPAHN